MRTGEKKSGSTLLASVLITLVQGFGGALGFAQSPSPVPSPSPTPPARAEDPAYTEDSRSVKSYTVDQVAPAAEPQSQALGNKGDREDRRDQGDTAAPRQNERNPAGVNNSQPPATNQECGEKTTPK